MTRQCIKVIYDKKGATVMGITVRQGPEKVSWNVLQFDKMIDVGILDRKYGGIEGRDLFPPGVAYTFYTELIEGEIVLNTRKVIQGKQKALNEEEHEQVIQPFRSMFGDKYHILLKHPSSVSFQSTVMPRLVVSLDDKPTVSNKRVQVFDSRRHNQTDRREELLTGNKTEGFSSNVLLVMEFSTDILSFGRVTKAELYARAGIPEYWIYRIPDQVLEVHRNPDKMKERYMGHGYRTVHQYSSMDSVAPVSTPNKTIFVSDVVHHELADRLW